MSNEIERKFSVISDAYKALATSDERITQGYLSSVPARTVRVRVRGNSGYLTIKGAANSTGTSRYEWEKEIDLNEANELLQLCEAGVIDKVRYLVPNGQFVFEVDEFFGENAGLVMAEIELNNETDSFDKPAWLGDELTGDKRYYNSMLSKNPYSQWPK